MGFRLVQPLQGVGLIIPIMNYVKKYFNWAVFENESKWYYNEPVMGNVFYGDADYMYNFCNENGSRCADTVFLGG